VTTSKGGPWSHIRQPNLLKRGGPASEAPAGLLPPVAAASVSVRQLRNMQGPSLQPAIQPVSCWTECRQNRKPMAGHDVDS